MHDATTVDTRYATEGPRTLAPAMTFVLMLARGRAHARGRRLNDSAVGSGAPAPAGRQELERLWELAEQFHPEQTWLAESWIRGERTLDELHVIAPREALAPGLVQALHAQQSPFGDQRVGDTVARSAALVAFG